MTKYYAGVRSSASLPSIDKVVKELEELCLEEAFCYDITNSGSHGHYWYVFDLENKEWSKESQKIGLYN